MKIGQIIDFAVTISITTIQGSHLFLLIYNPPSTSPYRIEANLLTDWISSCYAQFEINYLRFFSILGDFNLNDVCWATVTGQSDYSKNLFVQSQSTNLNPFVFEPTHKSGSTLDITLTSHSELFNVYVDSHLYSDHYHVFALLFLLFPIQSQLLIQQLCTLCHLFLVLCSTLIYPMVSTHYWHYQIAASVMFL